MVLKNTIKKYTEVFTVVVTGIEGYHFFYNIQKVYDILFYTGKIFFKIQNNSKGIIMKITEPKL